MLKSIHLHLDDSEEKQLEIESRTAPDIQRRLQNNIRAFQRYIPSVHKTIVAPYSARQSVFCNKNSEINIVDYGNGRVFYGLNPYAEIITQCSTFSDRPLTLNLIDGEAHYSQSLPTKVNVLAVFGIGAGHHINWLLEHYDIDHLVVYEPNLDFFKCSLSIIDWQNILRSANAAGTGIYLQLEKDGRDFYDNMLELSQKYLLSDVYLYKHYNHPVFDQLFSSIINKPWREMRYWVNNVTPSVTNYVPPWTLALKPESWSTAFLDNERFQKNLDALKTFFPDIHATYKNYEPSLWQPQANIMGEVNLVHTQTGAYFYGDTPSDECELSLESFARRPNKDGVILGYNGKKLRNYEHYKMVIKCDSALQEVEDSEGFLPSDIKSMIIFGLGVGYQLGSLLKERKVQNLFICEPNRDFFYASLFALNWEAIFTKLDSQKAHLYLNIGDDGTHLVEDLLRQFHSVGPYILANSFFYQGYYNADLVEAVGRLREQLKTIIAMGDYFDHAKYGIIHTRNSIENATPFLYRGAKNALSAELKEVPVFIIGNGPSLDSLIPIIKENQNEAILISCGTALQALHRKGITPDFHSEIEINRSTFDWATRIGDLDYLKSITLLSCNGIHPDTCSLYKDSYLAFKDGESSTVSFTELYPEHDWITLEHAYPTVANFAMDIVNQWDCRQVYLCGIDFGFVDPNYHHSKSSAYFTDEGEARFDYSEDNNTSLILPGNFRPTVYSKFEFKMSKNVLEESLSKDADIFNLSDGAKILGSMPLHPDQVLVMASAQQKKIAIETIKTKCYRVVDLDTFNTLSAKRYQHHILISEFDTFLKHAREEVSSRVDAEAYIERLRSILFESFKRKKSLLFFLLNSSLNYINSALTKALNIDDEEDMLQLFTKLQSYWVIACEHIFLHLKYDYESVDFTSSFASERVKIYQSLMQNQYKISYTLIGEKNRDAYLDAMELNRLDTSHFDANKSYAVSFEDIALNNGYSRVCRIFNERGDLVSAINAAKGNIFSLFLPGNFRVEGVSPVCNDVARIRFAIFALGEIKSLKLVLPKLYLDLDSQSVKDYYDIELLKDWYAYDAGFFIAFSDTPIEESQKTLLNGNRYRYVHKVTESDFIQIEMTLKEQTIRKEKMNNNFKSLRVLS